MIGEGLTVALGSQTYRVERPFGNWQPDRGGVSDVAIDSAGLIHVLVRHDSMVDGGAPAVVTFNRDGQLLSSWGGDIILDSHMLAPGPDGSLLIVDRDAHEVVMCRDGRRIGGFGRRHHPMQPFNHPTDVALAADGTVYVTDGYANSRVHRFAPDGTLLRSWGEQGDGPGQFMTPHAVWIMPDGRVVVCDRNNHRLQVFSPDGDLLAIWTGFENPFDIWGDRQGRLYVSDFIPSLTLLAPDGTRLGRCRPVLMGAHGIWGDDDGCLYFAEPNPNRVTRLVPIAAD